MAPVTISTAAVPAGFCGQGWEQDWPRLVALLSGELAPDLNIFNFGNSTPAPEQQGYPWFRTGSDGAPDKWYAFFNGVWVSRHALPPGAVMMYEGTEDSIKTFDGGEDATVGPSTGQMWEKVSEMDAKFPMGPGTLPNSETVVAVGATGGEETVELSLQNIPAHVHSAMATPDSSGGTGGDRLRAVTNAANSTHNTAAAGGDADGDTVKHQNLPPYRAIFFIRRTARLFYRV